MFYNKNDFSSRKIVKRDALTGFTGFAVDLCRSDSHTVQARCLVQMAVAFNMGVSECNRRTVSPQNRAVCSSQHPLGLSRPYSY